MTFKSYLMSSEYPFSKKTTRTGTGMKLTILQYTLFICQLRKPRRKNCN